MAAATLIETAFEALLGRSRGDPVLLLVDERLRILRAAPQANELADREEADLAGMSLIAAFGSAPLDGVARAALAAGEPVVGEAQLGPLGRHIFQVDAVPLEGGGLVLALHDITALRRIERVRRDFVANISHELRTPLTSIKLLAETLASGVDDPATAHDFATQIEREVDHLAQLVDELLDLTVIESGEVRLAIESLDPSHLVASVVERIGPVADRRGIAVRALPSPGSPSRAAADPARLEQALINLAHNAVKYSHPGGEIRLGWEEHGDRIRFLVADDGIGIPAGHQARIFERFYKVDRSRARQTPETEVATGSAGLGLAIVRHIAEAHGGAVGVESAEGVGSTFWIEVPAAAR
jgi:two-component system, OmpR family, phosphate regulon sensor histidine kinase PhoR